jgi:two-component system, NarL family, nitrate/nitrite response regulator NarL
MTMASNIELLLRSRLIKDALSAVLTKAGYSVCHDPALGDNATVIIIDFEDCNDPQCIGALQSGGAKIVVLASEADSREIAFDEVALLSGMLTYGLSADAFVQSLRLICSGERVFPHDLAVARRPKDPAAGDEPRSNADRLSPREREILTYLVAGDSNKLIARHLGITEATVKVHLKSVLRKIAVDNRTQAAIWAMSNLPEFDPTPRGFRLKLTPKPLAA